MEKGIVILLNGPSSGGKTTLSRNLQKKFPTPLYYTSYDLVEGEMNPYIHRYALDGEEDFLTVMYTMAKAVSDIGRHIVVDNCFFDNQRIYELAMEILKDNPVVLVRVKCPVEELKRREIARGDRMIGKAEWQNQHITPRDDGAYAVVVDTHADSSETCADKIIEVCRAYR